MHTHTITLDICIATYKRPSGLKRLLESILAQNLSHDRKARIIIIDNDPQKSAQPVVETFFADTGINYIYDMQPEKNIALTRNKALEYTTADYIVFVDDDEWVTPNWLESLVLASQQYDADVVFGPVIPEFPGDAPEWIIKGGFFKDGATKTGDLRQHGATNNALVRNSAQIKPLLHFDPDYGLTGGEDTKLFHKLYLKGAKLVWCNEAPVYETIPHKRLTIDWLVKRAFRASQNYARIFHKNLPLTKKILYLFKHFFYLLVVCAIFPFALIMGKDRWVWVLRKMAAIAGRASILLTDRVFPEYK